MALGLFGEENTFIDNVVGLTKLLEKSGFASYNVGVQRSRADERRLGKRTTRELPDGPMYLSQQPNALTGETGPRTGKFFFQIDILHRPVRRGGILSSGFGLYYSLGFFSPWLFLERQLL